MTFSNSNHYATPTERETTSATEHHPPLSEVKAPSTVRRDFWKNIAQRFGVNSALLSGALGLGALENLVAPSVARGELITLLGTQEAAKARGAAHTVQFGGNSVYIRADYDFPGFGPVTDYFSGFMVNPTVIGTAGHGFSAIAQYNPSYHVGLSADYKSATIEIPLTSFEFHPSYGGGVGGAGYDLARGRLAFAAPGVNDIVFWNGPRPAAGTDVLKIGYGLSGTSAGYDFADQGAARGVFSTLIDLPPSLGDPNKYIVSQTDPNRTDGGRSAPKDSGGPGMIWNPLTSQFELALMQIGGSSSPASPFSQHLYIDNEARSFLTATAVPEPNTFVMTAGALAAGWFFRRRRSAPKKEEQSSI